MGKFKTTWLLATFFSPFSSLFPFQAFLLLSFLFFWITKDTRCAVLLVSLEYGAHCIC